MQKLMQVFQMSHFATLLQTLYENWQAEKRGTCEKCATLMTTFVEEAEFPNHVTQSEIEELQNLLKTPYDEYSIQFMSKLSEYVFLFAPQQVGCF